MSLGIISVTYVRKGRDGMSHSSPAVPAFMDALKNLKNRAELRDEDFLNGIVVNEDEERIVQASGYSPDRGLFCDLY